MDLSRLQKEIQEIKQDKASGISVRVVGDNLTTLEGSISGPIDTPYEGGLFVVDIQIKGVYPFEPPKMRFKSKIWHPNVSSQNGAICLDILKDQWSPALTIKTALLSLQALLCSPEPNDPQDAVVAKQYLSDYALFESQAKHWTETYASAKTAKKNVDTLLEMGFDEDSAKKALDSAGGDLNTALASLLG